LFTLPDKESSHSGFQERFNTTRGEGLVFLVSLVQDIVYVVRKDPKKYARAIELLKVNDEVKKMKSISGNENL
jgi:hypothetical protein